MSIEASNPSGKTVTFSEKNHTFKIEDKYLKGTTSFISTFFPKFDSAYWSERKAKERKITKDEILAEWEAKAEKGRSEGTNVHSYAEYLIKKDFLGIKSEKPVPLSSRCAELFRCTEDAISWLTEVYTPISVEAIIFSKKLNLAGIVDALVQNDEAVCIVDWKQNREIKNFNPYQNGLGPLSHLQDHDFNKYSIQLNIYRKILIEEGYYPDIPPENHKMLLMHLTSNGYFPMRVAPMDDEIDAMIEQGNGLFPEFTS